MLSLPSGAASAAAVYALHSDAHRELIAQSHQRSNAYGLNCGHRPEHESLTLLNFSQALDENRLLYQHARLVMETLYEQIAHTHSVVLLTSRSGLILRSLGNADFLERAQRVALLPGVEWSEQSKGTNAIGTSLIEESSVVVHGHDHFLQAHQLLTCSCTPIFDPCGKVVGALDATGDVQSYHPHTIALVRMSAQMIENHLFANAFPDAMRLHFHAQLGLLNTWAEGIIVFSLDGRFVSANRSAKCQLGLSSNALKAHTFSSLFGLPVSQFFDRLRQAAGQPTHLGMYNGVTVCAQPRLRPQPDWFAGGLGAVGALTDAADTSDTPATLSIFASPAVSEMPPSMTFDPPLPATVQTPFAPAPSTRSAAQAMTAAHPSLPGLHALNTGDSQLAAVLHKLQRVQGNDIPIMVMGETGTGKDILAKAIHHDSTRAKRAFVSINCASIPEALIESELFGYEEGAFTGAKRRGAPGKIQMAHGGTLFLDEIGDMPTQLQARLLRVLQERRVTPLGSGKEYEVDVMLICATNRNLKAMMAQGQFRQDLYYRLNGLVVRLPALRERSDFDVVAQKILLSLNGADQPVQISNDVMNLFLRYRWPGNIRQLHNLLRTARVMVGAGGTIRTEHLPDDFLEEFQDAQGHPPHQPSVAQAQVPTRTLNEPLTEPGVHLSPAIEAPPNQSHQSAMRPPSPPTSTICMPGAARLQEVALQAMTETLRHCKGNVSAAAKLLGVSRNTIYRKKEQLPPDVWG